MVSLSATILWISEARRFFGGGVEFVYAMESYSPGDSRARDWRIVDGIV